MAKLSNNLKILIVAAAISAGFLIPAKTVHSAGCYAELSKAELKWNELRNNSEMTSGFERTVTGHLRSAAELRHQGDVKGCLEQIDNANEKMNNKKDKG